MRNLAYPGDGGVLKGCNSGAARTAGRKMEGIEGLNEGLGLPFCALTRVLINKVRLA